MRPELEGKPSMGSSSKFFAEVIKLWDVFSIQCGLANGNQFNILARVTIAKLAPEGRVQVRPSTPVTSKPPQLLKDLEPPQLLNFKDL